MTKKLAVIISNVTLEEIAAIHEYLALYRKKLHEETEEERQERLNDQDAIHKLGLDDEELSAAMRKEKEKAGAGFK